MGTLFSLFGTSTTNQDESDPFEEKGIYRGSIAAFALPYVSGRKEVKVFQDFGWQYEILFE